MNGREGFAVWITGLPASGKSSITRELAGRLNAEGISVVVLESDELRKILTPDATYEEEERARFYRMFASIGEVIVRSGVNVIFDATANRRSYREYARKQFQRFIEVYVETDLNVCKKRDPKGIYARAAKGEAMTVPGINTPYEAPLNPEIRVNGEILPHNAADTILDKLKRSLYL